MKYLLAFSFFVAFVFTMPAQSDVEFGSPVDHQIRLSGTFGELRPNHFHSGIDIKGGIGLPIYAVEDGYVARVKVSSAGYGKTIYLKHPNGYTSVYAHMNHFFPELEAYIKKLQLSKKSFEVQDYPSAIQFKVKKGQKIGEIGMTGRSFGPHLHFEIRKSSNSHPVNPLRFNFAVKDQRQPIINQIRVYEMDADRHINQAVSYDTHRSGDHYLIDKDTLYVNSTSCGVAVKTYDLMDEVSNWNGVYNIKMKVDGDLKWEFVMDEFSFGESRYVNAHMDYEEQVSKKSYFNRCFLLPGNKLSTYKNVKANGVITVNPNKAKEILIQVRDIAGNERNIRFWLKQKKNAESISSTPFNYILPYNEKSVIQQSGLEATIPKGCLYEDLYLSVVEQFEDSSDIYSTVYNFGDYTIPAHKYFTLKIKPFSIPEPLRSKAYIAYCDKDGDTSNYGGQWDGRFLSAEVRNFGQYMVKIDTVAPSIKELSCPSKAKVGSKMSFEAKDDVETSGKVKYLRYHGTVDGEWALVEYDAKKDRFTYYVSKDLDKGKHIFRLEIKDALKNKAVFERSFTME